MKKRRFIGLERGLYWDREWILVSYHNGAVQIKPESLRIPFTVNKPAAWAVRHDLFHPDVPLKFITWAFEVMSVNLRHVFIVLTDYPERIKEVSDGRDFLSNVFIGVSAENQERADSRLSVLRRVASHWYTVVSLDPLLGPVNLAGYLDFLDWVIIGAESIGSRPGRPCNPEWIKALVEQCDDADVPVFVKQAHLKGRLVKSPFIRGLRRLETPA